MTDPGRLLVGPSPVHGRGVFTRVPIAEGELVGTFEGVPTDTDGDHVLWIQTEGGDWAGVRGTGILRWLNHSRDANVEFDGVEVRALRAIETGEELLVDYGEEWAEIP